MSDTRCTCGFNGGCSEFRAQRDCLKEDNMSFDNKLFTGQPITGGPIPAFRYVAECPICFLENTLDQLEGDGNGWKVFECDECKNRFQVEFY